MKTLSEIVTLRVKDALERSRELAEERGEEFDLNLVVARMSEIMGMSRNTIRKQLYKYLGDKAKWRMDYLEALVRALEVGLDTVVLPPGRPRLMEASVGQFLHTSLGDLLSPEDARQLVGIVHAAIENDELHKLGLAIGAALTNSQSASEARERIDRLLLAPCAKDAFAHKIPSRKKKSPKRAER